MKYDKVNGKVGFIESSHVYENVDNPNLKYISVTTLIERFGQKFDSEFWSKYKALEKLIPADDWKIEKKSLQKTKRFDKEILSVYNISELDFNKACQEILDSWTDENKKSCERGTKIHAELENSFYGRTDISLQKFGIGGQFQCKKDYSDLTLDYGVYPEYLISRESEDGILRLAGQIDLIVKSGNDIILIDHKTNKKIDTKSFYDSSKKSSEKMKYPLNTLDDCNFNHYQLQLSTYAWMLQKINPNFIIKDLILNHYDHSGKNTLYHCKYLKHEVELMLKYYKKQLLIEQTNAKYKRIEY